MTAPPVSGDPSGEFAAFSSVSEQGNDRKSASLVLSPAEHTREALMASSIAVEYIRVATPADSRVTAKYAATVVDNSRLLAGGNPRLHLNLLRGHVAWLRSLPTGLGLR